MTTQAAEPGLAGREAPHLWDYLDVVLRRRRLVLAVVVGVTALAGLRALLTRPVYQATAQILIERDNPNVVTFKEVTEVDAARDDYYQTQYKLLQSRALARRVIESLSLARDPEFGGGGPAEVQAASPGASTAIEPVVDAVLSRLKVQPVRNSRLVTVSFESQRPDMASRVANKLAELYITQTLELRYSTSAEAGQWLGKQIQEQQRKVAEAEANQQALKEREGIVNIEERRTLVDQKLKEVGSALTALRTARLQKEALYRQMRSAPNPQELPDVLRYPVVQSLYMEMARLEREKAELLELYLEEHPEVVKVSNQIRETRQKIGAESERVIRSAQNDYEAAAAQEASLAAALEAAKAEALDLSRRGVPYDAAKRDLDAAKEVLNSLLSRHKQTDVSQELTASNIRIVDPATVPRAPVRPRPLRDALLGLILGTGLAVGGAFFLDYLDNTFKTPDGVRAYLEIPLLAVVAESEEDAGQRVLKTVSRTTFAEDYRILRTALNYSWSERGPRVVLVTSSIPGEGKTLTAVNLAMTLARMDGGKVLLVDADMRKPEMHVLLGLERAPGLSDVLVGEATAAEALRTIPENGLHVLPAGNEAPSPADLMSTHVMEGFLNGLRSQYNWVVIDSPPVGAVAEPLILAPLTDGVAMVVGAESVPRRTALHCLERIQATGARVLGAVFNRAQVDEGSSYGYGYGSRKYYGQYHKRAAEEALAGPRERGAP